MASKSNKKNILKSNKYTIVSLALDLSESQSFRKIKQFSAYTPEEAFSYVKVEELIEFMICPGYLCILEDEQCWKFSEKKNVKSAIKSFIVWMEKITKVNKSSMGIILLCHEGEIDKILKLCRKYGLRKRFLKTVKFFTNTYQLVKDKCPNKLKNYSLRLLSLSILKNDQRISEHNVAIKSKLVYNIIERLAQRDKGKDQEEQRTTNDAMIELIRKYTQNIAIIYK